MPDVVQGPEWDTVFSGSPLPAGDGFVGVLGAGQLDAQVLSLRRVDESGEESWRKELSPTRAGTSGASSPTADAPQAYLAGAMRDGERRLVAVAVTEPGTTSGLTQAGPTGRLVGFDAVSGEQVWGPLAAPQLVSGQARFFGDGVLQRDSGSSATLVSTRDGSTLWQGSVVSGDALAGSGGDRLLGVSSSTGVVRRGTGVNPYALDVEARELPGGRVLWTGAQLTPPEGVSGQPVVASLRAGYAGVVWRDAVGANRGLTVVEVATGRTVAALRGAPGGGGGGEDDEDDVLYLLLDRLTDTLLVADASLIGAVDVAERRVLWQRTVGEAGTVAFKPAYVAAGQAHGTGTNPVVLDVRTGEVRASGQFGFPTAVTDDGVTLYPFVEGEGTYVAYRRRG